MSEVDADTQVELLTRKLERFHKEVEAKDDEIEIARMKLGACGEAALANTRDISCHVAPEYESASLQEVRNAVEREMNHREHREKAEARVKELTDAIAAIRDEHVSGDYPHLGATVGDPLEVKAGLDWTICKLLGQMAEIHTKWAAWQIVRELGGGPAGRPRWAGCAPHNIVEALDKAIEDSHKRS